MDTDTNKVLIDLNKTATRQTHPSPQAIDDNYTLSIN